MATKRKRPTTRAYNLRSSNSHTGTDERTGLLQGFQNFVDSEGHIDEYSDSDNNIPVRNTPPGHNLSTTDSESNPDSRETNTRYWLI